MSIKAFLGRSLLKWLIVPLIIFLLVYFYRWFPWIPEDNPLEEKVEFYVEKYTGKDVDLSPNSKENDG